MNESQSTDVEFNDGDLIEIVEKFSHIYDKKSTLFKDEKAKYNAWQTIAFTLKSTPEVCQQRWTALRARYVGELRKIKCIPSGSAAITSTWHLFSVMGFLSKHVQSRRSTKGNVYSDKPPAITSSEPIAKSPWDSISEIIQDDPETENIENKTETSLTVSTQSIGDIENVQPFAENPAKKDIPLGELRKEVKRRRKGDLVPPSLEKAWGSVSSYFEQRHENTRVPEEDTFGKFVGQEVIKIKNNDLQDELKEEILKLIFEFKKKDKNV